MIIKYLKKNQKKAMAIFSVGLMIAFALPSAMQKYTGQPGGLFGYIGNTEIGGLAVENARREWTVLRSQYIHSRTAQGESSISFADQLVGPQLSRKIEANPVIFYLLKLEAARMGIAVSRDELGEVDANRMVIPNDSVSDSERLAAFHSFLLVQNAWRQVAGSMHLSTPQLLDRLSQMQDISMNLVEFKSSDFLQQLPPWSKQQQDAAVDKVYEQYKDVLPGAKGTDDFSFGYRIPNRVQTQSIEIPIEEVKKVVAPGISEIDAYKFFLQNPDRFASTQPTTATSKPVATTQKSFKDFRQQAYTLLTDDLAHKQAQAIVDDITTQMSADFTEFKRVVGDHLGAHATTLPTSAPTPPMTRFNVAYNSAAYLQALAQHEKEQFKILPVVSEDPVFRSAEDLGKTPIGSASVNGMDIGELYNRTHDLQFAMGVMQARQFPIYATTYSEPLASDQELQTAQRLNIPTPALLEPSPVMNDPKGNAFIFRIARADASHPAAKIDVYQQVLTDARSKAAYEMARAHAEVFLKDAGSQYLQTASETAKKQLYTTNFFGANNATIEGYSIPHGPAQEVFARAAFALLLKPGQSNHPKGIVDMKPTATALAGEINGIQPHWDVNSYPAWQVELRREVAGQDARDLAALWFNFDDISRRMNYRPAKEKSENNAPSDDSQPPGQAPFGS
jgi:hypothetical protein